MKFILHRLKENNRLNIILLFFLMTLFCVLLVAYRLHFTDRVHFGFLVWNIFLALIPYGISTWLVIYHERFRNRWWIAIPFICWLCFFPNAPYILTDLFHLRKRPYVPLWYDLGIFIFFAFNGLMLGYASLLDIQSVLTSRFNKWVGWSVSIISLILGSFGIYLGRYLRWNSWDVLYSPLTLFRDIIVRIIDPVGHPQTYGVTIIFSMFLVMGYLLLFHFAHAYRMPSSSSQ